MKPSGWVPGPRESGRIPPAAQVGRVLGRGPSGRGKVHEGPDVCRRMRPAALLLVLLMATPLVSAQGVPADAVCATNEASGAVGESRYFCEAMDSLGFVQFDQFVAGLEYLDETYPDFIELKIIGESLGGLPIYFVEVTNEASDTAREDKLQLGYSASIHANEAAGREGMTRMIEDLVAGIGPHGADLKPLLDHQIVNVWFPNPDSWASGDYFDADSIAGLHSPADGTGYARTNLAGVDLNREFPNPGLIHKDHTPMSEPESQAVVKELRFSGEHSNLVAGVDLHGMINSENMIRSIIPNQDYDFRRMVLAVDMLRTTEERVNTDPAFAEWSTAASLVDLIGEGTALVGEEPVVGTPLGGVGLEDPMEWGARWDMIGYTDTGFTSDYLMLSPRSPTGGMGAVGTITEFAYSHMVPDNKYVAKLTDMHVAGVRQMVRTQMEMVGRLDTPVLAGTGPVAYLDDGTVVSSRDDPAPYEAGHAFDIDDESTWFDFDQVPFEVSNLAFWEDLGRFSSDPVEPLPTATFTSADLEGYEHLVLTDQVLDALTETQVHAIEAWVDQGGHVLLTDASLGFLERAGIGPGATQLGTYLGYSDVQDWDHALVDDVDWGARVTGEGPAIGMPVGGPYPQWVLAGDPGGDVVGTTQGSPSLGRLAHGDGSIDYLGAALPVPQPINGTNQDHRYGLADYSVSAFTYWIVMNSLGGAIDWQPVETPFVPYYDFDPLYGDASEPEDHDGEEQDSPPIALWAAGAALVAAAAVVRRRR